MSLVTLELWLLKKSKRNDKTRIKKEPNRLFFVYLTEIVKND